MHVCSQGRILPPRLSSEVVAIDFIVGTWLRDPARKVFGRLPSGPDQIRQYQSLDIFGQANGLAERDNGLPPAPI